MEEKRVKVEEEKEEKAPVPKYLKNPNAIDEWYTTEKIWADVVPFLDKKKIYWECFWGKNSDDHSAKALRRLGLKVVSLDVDFFKVTEDIEAFRKQHPFDVIISNPPFSKKTEVMNRLKEIGAPFVLILPQFALGMVALRQFSRDIQLIVPRERMQFLDAEMKPTVSNTTNMFFYLWRIHLPKDLIILLK
jgi:hypothetical protein